MTPLENAQMKLAAAKKQYTKDSLDFVNSDSIKAKEKLAKLETLRDEYLGINPNDTDSIKDTKRDMGMTIALLQDDKNIQQINNAITDAMAQIDIATGKVAQKAKEKVAKTEALVKAEKIIEKELNNEPITKEEKYFAFKVLNTHILDGMIESQEQLTKISEILKKVVNEKVQQDSIMNEFNKVVAE